jgi:hypothetical protein
LSRKILRVVEDDLGDEEEDSDNSESEGGDALVELAASEVSSVAALGT